MGLKHLEAAAAELPGLSLDVRRLPFFLYPDLPRLSGSQAMADAERWRGGYPLKWGERLDQLYGPGAKPGLRELGQSVGYNFDFDVVGSNTFDSYRMLLWAEDNDVGMDYGKSLARRYFEERQMLSDHGMLVEAAKEVGLDEADARAFLDSDGKAEEVRTRYSEVKRSGLTSIPLFLLELGGRKASIHGSASVADFASALHDLMSSCDAH